MTFKVKSHVIQKGDLSCSLGFEIDCDHPFDDQSAFSGRFAVPRPLVLNMILKVNFETKMDLRCVISVVSMIFGPWGKQNVVDTEVKYDDDANFTDMLGLSLVRHHKTPFWRRTSERVHMRRAHVQRPAPLLSCRKLAILWFLTAYHI